MRTATVTFAGKQYEVKRLPVIQAVAWRKKAEALLEAFPALAEMYNQEAENTVKASLEVFKASNDVIEQLIDVVFSADGALANDKSKILEVIDDSELLEAFQTIMLCNAPLASMAVSQDI